jgi:hypothetical protein
MAASGGWFLGQKIGKAEAGLSSWPVKRRLDAPLLQASSV